ncbi:MAG: NIPSNAP family protein [Pseudomonadota bacterium]
MQTDSNTEATLISPIVDLRQYTLYPGTRDRFVELFDTQFVETQEEVGIRLIGQFRDLGDPNRFVWLRGYADMPVRQRALHAFYVDGQPWKDHAPAARSMMIDSSDVLMLKPLDADGAFRLEPPARRPALAAPVPDAMVLATIHHLSAAATASFAAFYRAQALPHLLAAGGRLLGLFVTEHSANNFPRHPVREGENVLVSFIGFESVAHYHRHLQALGDNRDWGDDVYPALTRQLQMPPQLLRLSPTSRSQLR